MVVKHNLTEYLVSINYCTAQPSVPSVLLYRGLISDLLCPLSVLLFSLFVIFLFLHSSQSGFCYWLTPLSIPSVQGFEGPPYSISLSVSFPLFSDYNIFYTPPLKLAENEQISKFKVPTEVS